MWTNITLSAFDKRLVDIKNARQSGIDETALYFEENDEKKKAVVALPIETITELFNNAIKNGTAVNLSPDSVNRLRTEYLKKDARAVPISVKPA